MKMDWFPGIIKVGSDVNWLSYADQRQAMLPSIFKQNLKGESYYPDEIEVSAKTNLQAYKQKLVGPLKAEHPSVDTTTMTTDSGFPEYDPRTGKRKTNSIS